MYSGGISEETAVWCRMFDFSITICFPPACRWKGESPLSQIVQNYTRPCECTIGFATAMEETGRGDLERFSARNGDCLLSRAKKPLRKGQLSAIHT